MNTTAAKFQIPDFKFQTCPEFGEGFKVQDSRFQIPNFKFQIKKPQYSSHQHIITSTHQLSTINRQPLFRTTNNEQRTTINHQPSTINHQPSTIIPNNEQRTTNNFFDGVHIFINLAFHKQFTLIWK